MYRSTLIAALLVTAPALAAADAPAKEAPAKKAPSKGAPAQKGRVVERVIAVVEGDIVLLSEVESVVEDIMRAEPPPPGVDREAYRQRRRQEVLDTLIADRLLEQEIKKLRIDVTEREIDRIVESTKQQHGLDDQKLQQALAQQGLTLGEYREGLKKQLMKAKIIQLKVKNRVQVTDEEVKTTMAQRRALVKNEYRVRARHILFLVPEGQDDAAAKARAEQALARIRAGEDFTKVAQEVSEGPSAKNGGDLGVFGRGEMVPAFEKAAFAAEPGQVVGPVRTPFGWHLILVDERVPMEEPTSENVEEQLRQQLYEAEVERAFQQYIEELRRAAYIDVRI